MTFEQYAKQRKRLKESHASLAARLGITRATSWKYENDGLAIPVAVGLALKSLKVKKAGK